MGNVFTFSPGTVADYCFTYSIYDSPAGASPANFPLTPSADAPIPSRVSGVSTVLFNYAAGMLPYSQYTGVIPYQIKATSILTTGPSALAPLTVKFYHECYYATITAPSDQTNTYFVGDPDASLSYAPFTTLPTGCAISYSLLDSSNNAASTSLFAFSITSSEELVTLRSTTDNSLAVSSPIVLTLKGALQYGTATATAQVTFIVVENPCLNVVIPNPPGTTVTYDFTLSS